MRQRITLVVVLLCAISLQVVAQVNQLAGSVRWQNGVPAQGVALTIGAYTLVTDRSGAYSFKFLRPGTYSVAVSPSGKPAKSFKVQVGRSHTPRFHRGLVIGP
jgi:hypothetical protein